MIIVVINPNVNINANDNNNGRIIIRMLLLLPTSWLFLFSPQIYNHYDYKDPNNINDHNVYYHQIILTTIMIIVHIMKIKTSKQNHNNNNRNNIPNAICNRLVHCKEGWGCGDSSSDIWQGSVASRPSLLRWVQSVYEIHHPGSYFKGNNVYRRASYSRQGGDVYSPVCWCYCYGTEYPLGGTVFSHFFS